MENNKIKIPFWYWIVSGFLLLWNLMGVFSFFAHTFISEESLATLPANEKALYDEFSIWTTIIFAIAVAAGMIGTIGLILKKKWSKMAFVISLLAIIPQMIYNVFYTKSIEVYGTAEAVTMPVIVLAFGLLSVWFSNYCSKKQWLK